MSEVTDNEGRNRFEIEEEGETAFVTYVVDGDRMSLTHTIVPPSIEGHGVGSRLVRGALDEVRARGMKVVPQCTFVRGYIERHPEYKDLLAA